MSSKVWAWVGRKVEFGGKRWKKMEEIAKRLSVGVVSVLEFLKPREMGRRGGGREGKERKEDERTDACFGFGLDWANRSR